MEKSPESNLHDIRPVTVRSGASQRSLVKAKTHKPSSHVKFTPNVKVISKIRKPPKIEYKADILNESLEQEFFARGSKDENPSPKPSSEITTKTNDPPKLKTMQQQFFMKYRTPNIKLEPETTLSLDEIFGGSKSTLAIYPPLSLPFRIQRQTNRESVANMILNAEGLNDWFFLQFPGALPAFTKKTQETTHEEYTPTKLEDIPNGFLGKLQIHQSGRVTLKIGGCLFDVHPGTTCNFAQEVACFTEGHNELLFLGECKKRLVVTPNIEIN